MVGRSFAARTTALMVLALAAAEVRAGLLTFQFGGVVESVQDPGQVLAGLVGVGGSFRGGYTFDPNAPDLYPGDPRLGVYESPSASMLVNVGNLFSI